MKFWTATVYLLARYEVRRARTGKNEPEKIDCADGLAPELVPSLRLDGLSPSAERVLAEIDQDGFVFAVDDRDRSFFHGRGWIVPRRHHRIQIIWSNGAIRLRKTFAPKEKGVGGWLRNRLHWELYVEAAALLRLRGTDGVPVVRNVNLHEGIIEMDYIWGHDLRRILGEAGSHIDYEKTSRSFGELLAGRIERAASRALSELLDRVARRGVIPRDLHAANVIRAFSSGRLYLVDFNVVYILPKPGGRSEQWLGRMMRTAIGGLR